MSENNKRDEGLQDYMDLLEKMAEKDAKNQEKKPSPPPIKEKIEEPIKKSEKVKNIKILMETLSKEYDEVALLLKMNKEEILSFVIFSRPYLASK